MIKTRILTLVALGIFLISGCDPDMKRGDKYERPEWLAGKVYTQLLDQPDLSTFAECVALSGYDTIIDRSGSYTIFAPNNEAFTAWFQKHPIYNGLGDIPGQELDKLVKYHIVQNPWSKAQLRSLDVWGWIDTLDINNDEPRGFKRETLLLEKNRKLGIGYNEADKDIQIVDTLESDWYRMFLTDSRKYVPIFFKGYFDIYDLSTDDYHFYFDRSIESGDDLYFAGAKILGDEIFAENGFVYNVDKVVDPLQNAYELLETASEGKSYTQFLNLLNRFPEFRYNEARTFDQPGAEEGFVVDSLFDLTYPELAFDILNEETTAPRGTFGLPGNVSIRYHHGMVAPTNEALDRFITDYLVGTGKWGDLESAPKHIKRIIANTHLSTNPVYPTDLENGFYNGEDDRVMVDLANVVHKQYGSNCTFMGVDEAIIPRAFKSVTGPIYQQRGYSFSMFAIEDAGLLAALKRESEDYMFFVESDADCQQDSSLLYDYSSESFFLYQGSGLSAQRYGVNTNELRTLILNHIGTRNPRGIARKEFIKNLAGNYLVINNETGEVKGTAPTTVGYKGEIQTADIPRQISEDADNGISYEIDNWYSFSATNLYLKISGEYPGFHDLLKKAGLSKDKEYRYTFISDNENYTIFVPSDSALNAARADTLNQEDLRRLLLLHFVQGELIFTDGDKLPAYYETTRIDESSTEFTTVFSKIYVEPGYDVITIPDKSGNDYLTINESDGTTNIMTGISLGEGTEVFPMVLINTVIHETDRVLNYEDLDSN
ncbi:MAG: fasciclin domain-containing protein [Bacteroidota bacterium]